MSRSLELKRIIITGQKQSGKSTLAAQLADALKKQKIKIAGIIAQGIWENNRRVGFDLINLKTGQSFPLARRIKTPDKNAVTCFKFFKTGLDAGFFALSLDQCKDADIIFVDEIGKLEIKKLGWSNLLFSVLKIDSAVHVWIVRDIFIKKICSIWQVKNTEIIHINSQNPLNRMIKICTA